METDGEGERGMGRGETPVVERGKGIDGDFVRLSECEVCSVLGQSSPMNGWHSLDECSCVLILQDNCAMC